jgi:hypothetical protein
MRPSAPVIASVEPRSEALAKPVSRAIGCAPRWGSMGSWMFFR